ncbi:hypothetical protein ACFQ60_00500 [Streptomyces zhihengii]|uniref:Tetracyclin repressor-like C-terminal domain-containing protein n=1 Tax=Streptomyces zhihengii TaxID=1818004 RepID=A0ABS2V3G4_9ACTN|nr:hypothetical protein [Streptomyces zhihengii]MBM9624396.1 hypothetical protein [Streptomyces zhihengii]
MPPVLPAAPSEAVQRAYASDPALAGMRMDFTDLMRRTAAVTTSGLLARQEASKGNSTA